MRAVGSSRFDPLVDADPDALSPEVRLRAVAALLATGVRRLRERGAFDVGPLAEAAKREDSAEKSLEPCRR